MKDGDVSSYKQTCGRQVRSAPVHGACNSKMSWTVSWASRKAPQLSSGTWRAIERVLEESLQKRELHRNSIREMIQENLLQNTNKTWLLPTLRMCNFHSLILAQDLHQTLNNSRSFQPLNGELNSHLPAQVLPRVISIIGCHWYDIIFCSCRFRLNRRCFIQLHSSKTQPMGGILTMKKQM